MGLNTKIHLDRGARFRIGFTPRDESSAASIRVLEHGPGVMLDMLNDPGTPDSELEIEVVVVPAGGSMPAAPA